MVQNMLHSLVQEQDSGCLWITHDCILSIPYPPGIPQDALILVCPFLVSDIIDQVGCSLNFTLPPFFSQFHIFTSVLYL